MLWAFILDNRCARSQFAKILDPAIWFVQGRGPRYKQLYRHLKASIDSGALASETALPPEREMALHAGMSRVTIRKAISDLATDGLLTQKQGSANVISPKHKQRLRQSLSSLVSFTETMELRGYKPRSEVLQAGIFQPTALEIEVLHLGVHQFVARIKRLRFANSDALAIETSSVPAEILPDPSLVSQSLYAVLRQKGKAPSSAMQRISAVNLNDYDASLLGVNQGTAFLKVDRTGYLDDMRPVEFTTGVYHSDIYDFMAEVRLET